MRTLITLLIMTFSFSQAQAAELSFSRAKDLALKHSRIIKAYEQELRAATYKTYQAKGGYLPRINIVESGMKTDEPGNAAFAKIAQGRFDMDYFLTQMQDPNGVTNYTTKIELIQPVYMNGKIHYGIKQAGEMKRASQYTLERVKQQVLYNLHRAFYGVSLAEKALSVTRESYQRMQKYYETSQSFFNNGMLVKSDLLVAQSFMLKNEVAIREAERRVAVGRSSLQRALGVEGDFHILWENPDNGLKNDLDDYLKKALLERQDLKAMKAYLDISGYEMKKSRSKFLPEIALFANYGWNDDRVFGDAGEGYTVGAQVKLNLFSGFSDYNSIREQKSLHQALLDRIADKKLEIEADVKDGYYTVLAAQKGLEAARKRAEAAREALAITQNRFRAGILKVTDLLDREVETKEAELGRYKSTFDLILGKAKLLFAAGILN